MRSVLLVFTILAVLGILVGAAFLATYEGDVLRDPYPDDRDAELPPGAVQPEDIAELRFDLAFRGYRMAEVDRVLHRLSDELAARDTRIAELEQALVDAPLASAPLDTTPAPDEQTSEVAPVDVPPAPPVASAPLDTPPAEPEQTSEVAPVDVPPAPPVASAPVDTPPAEPEQTSEVAPVAVPPAPPVASAPVDIPPAEPEQTQEGQEGHAEAPEVYEPLEPPGVAPAAISGPLTATTWFTEPAPVEAEPAPVEEHRHFTLDSADDAFSFPELTPPPPAEPAPQPDSTGEEPPSP
jgi:DivIVA domain-containing protein